MKKKLTFMFVALITVAAFAIQSKRAASALIDYPTSQSGITLYTLGTDGGVKFSEVAVKGTNVSAIEFGKSIKNTETEKYYAELSVEGGFKAGDIITINGCYSNKDAKETAIVFYKADLSTELWKTDKFPNVNDGTTDVLVQSYTLTEDVEKIYCGRSGGTKTYLTKLTITREEASGDKYNVTVAEGITNGTVKVDKATAAEGEEVTITTTPADGYMLDAISVTCKTINQAVTVKDGKFTMPADDVTVNATFKVKPVDVAVAAGDITGGDITAAIATKAAGKPIGNLTINLAAGAYTISKSIEAGAGVKIVGAAGAKIDASALTTPFILMSKTPAVAGTTVGTNEVYNVAEVSVKDVEITGLPYQLFFANGVRYLVGKLSVDNSVIGINGTNKKTIFDFAGRGCAEEISVNNSTIWANPSNAQNGGLYSSQSGDWAGDLGGTKQILSITNSTIYNIANGKTICTQRQNSKTGMGFVVKNSIILDSGKSGQFVVGLDGGSYKSAPTWDIDKNAFNFGGADVSAAESAKVVEGGGTADIIKNSIAGVVAFANTDYATTGNFTLGASSLQNKLQIGDPRWQVEFVGFDVKVVNTEGLTITPEVTKAAVGEKVYCTYVLAEDYKLERPDFVDDDNNPIEFVDGTTCGLEEVGGVEKMWIIMPAKNVTIKAKVTAMPKFYIIGDMNGWDRTAMTKMTYNDESGRYEYDYAPTTTAYFAFADYQQTAEEAAADGSWTTFNSTYRYSLGAGNVDATIGEIKSLTKGVDGTIVLQPGTYKISVEKDFNAVTITGEVAPPPAEDTYVVAGAPASLFGTEWSGNAEANKMTKNTETGLYELKFTGVAFTAATTIEYKIVKNSSIWIPDGVGNNQTVSIPAAGTYDITFTFNPEGSVITGVATVATGIGIINVDGVNDIFSDGKPVYNLSGQRVFKGYKGVVIKNGKKIVVK